MGGWRDELPPARAERTLLAAPPGRPRRIRSRVHGMRVTLGAAAGLAVGSGRLSGPLAPVALLGSFAVVFVLAVVARRLVGLQGGLIRTLLCAALGVAVGGTLIGPRMHTAGETAALFPVMVGVQLVTTAVALVVIDAVLPRRSVLAWIREAKRRYARTRRYAQVSAIATRNGLVRRVRVRPNFADHERNVSFARSLRRTLEEAGVTFVKLGQLPELDKGDAGFLKGAAQRARERDVPLMISEVRPHPDPADQSVAGRDGTDLRVSAGSGVAALRLPDPCQHRAPGQDSVDDDERHRGCHQLDPDHHREERRGLAGRVHPRADQGSADGYAERGAQQRADQPSLQPD